MTRRFALYRALSVCLMTQTVHAQWRANPYLLLDQTIISSVDNLDRQIQHPTRLPEPVVDAEHDQNFQPFMTVIQDPKTRRFRMWYDIPSAPRAEDPSRLALIESEDAIHWIRPHKVCDTPTIKFGASVID